MDTIRKSDTKPDFSDVAKPAYRNSRGHLHVHEVNFIIETWLARSSNYGALSNIARQLGTSTVTVSNVILRETGKRPTFHALTTEN
ncbi:MAG: hypothetical protein AAFR39_14380 [Pseudomonadota bacterium]